MGTTGEGIGEALTGGDVDVGGGEAEAVDREIGEDDRRVVAGGPLGPLDGDVEPLHGILDGGGDRRACRR